MPSKHAIKLYVEGGCYHVYNRGVEKRKIFLDQQDYAVFLRFLKEYLLPKNHDPHEPMSERRQELWEKATERLVDPEIQRVMAYFGEIPDTRELYQTRFKPWVDGITY